MGNTGYSFGTHLHFEHFLNIDNPNSRQDPSLIIKRINLGRNHNVVVAKAAETVQTVREGITRQIRSGSLVGRLLSAIGFEDPNQEVPMSKGPAIEETEPATSGSRPKNRPKMLLLEVPTDLTTSYFLGNKRGTKSIKVREDISNDIQNIKSILNFYEIPLSCMPYDINIKNNNLSYFGKVGLEVALNLFATLTQESSINRDDYFVGPDYSKPLGNGYKLKIYGNVRRKFQHEKYRYEEKIIDIYDIKETYLINKPNIKKIFKPVIDITKIFEDHGFIQKSPMLDFFEKSDNNKSNWNIFYKPSKFIIGYTYRELLDTVYDLKKFPYLEIPNMKWDGHRFIKME